MRKIVAVLILLVCFTNNVWAEFNGPAIPRAVPFASGGKTYVAYVQTWHPHYNQSKICYYSSDFDQAYAPIIAKSGVIYGGLVNVVVLLNPASFGQAWDSTSYNDTNTLCAFYYSGSWVVDVSTPTNINYVQYGWNDWYFNGSYGYDHDLSHNVRAVGIDVKVNETYNFAGQFYLGSYTSGDVLVTGSSLFKWPLSGTFASRTQTKTFGANWVLDCPSGTPKKHGGLDVDATYGEDVYAAHAGTVKDINYDAGWEYGIVVEDTTGQYTTVYWHVNAYGGLAVNDTVTKGQKIATVANLGGNTHFHFGIRSGAYNASLSLAGALPVASCGSSPVYPAFPENLIDPAVISY